MKQYDRFDPEHYNGTDKRKIDIKEFNQYSFSEKFAARLNQFRLERNITQEELAKKIGVNRTTIANYENGKRSPDIEICCRIAECFGVSMTTLTENISDVPAYDYIWQFSKKARDEIGTILNEEEYKKTAELLLENTEFRKVLKMIYLYCTYSSKADKQHEDALTEQDRNNMFGKVFSDLYLPYDDIGRKNTCDWFRCAAHAFLDDIINDIKNNKYFKKKLEKNIDDYISEQISH